MWPFKQKIFSNKITQYDLSLIFTAFPSKFKETLSRTFFGFFSKMATKLRLSAFNHAGNAPRR